MFGKKMTVNEVLDEVEKDASFYRNTGGGMTMSGGECHAATGLRCRFAEGSPRSWLQYGDRNSVQCALGYSSKKYCPMLIRCCTTTS